MATAKKQTETFIADDTCTTVGPHVFAAINQVQAALGKEGISKDRTAGAGGGGSYKFRGIDDVYAALSRHIAEAGLVITPSVLSRDFREAVTKHGGILYYTTLFVQYTLTSVKDGSSITATVVGEAMDSSDKSANKAMSAAYKYMAFQVFCIPTEGDHDTENHNHQAVGPMTAPVSQRPPATNRLTVPQLADALNNVHTISEITALYFDNEGTIRANKALHDQFATRKNLINSGNL